MVISAIVMMMRLSNLSFGLPVIILVATSGLLWTQGVSSRGVQPVPRGKPSGVPFHSRFIDVARQAGLTAPVIYGPEHHKDFILEVTGSGVAWLDYDSDGWIDALILSGTRRDNPPPEATNRLYRNRHDGTFEDVTAKAGLLRTGWASSVTVGDYDNDGHEDLFLTYWGQNVLYRNRGDGTFEDVTAKAGLLRPDTQWGSGATWIDYDRDGDLDLFVATYLRFDWKDIPKPGQNAACKWKGVPVNCGPRGLPTSGLFIYRNDGSGTFSDVTKSSGIGGATGSYAMTAVAADFDSDGWPDVYVACDSTRSYLFRNNRDGTLVEEGVERGAALSEDGMEQAGMGVGVGDFDLDGDLDILKTHFADDTHILYRNTGNGTFDDVTLSAGLGVETRYLGWGAGISDLDNDGWPDLLIVTGSVYPEIERQLPQYAFKTPRLIFRNLGAGKFEELIQEAGPGIAAQHSSRGAAFGDYDNDGDTDVLVWNMNEPPSLLRNDLDAKRNWVKLRLIGTKSNRSAIGATATVRYGARQQAQAVLAQASYYSANDRRLHYGVDDATTVDVTVRWPNGGTQTVSKLPVNQLHVITEAAVAPPATRRSGPPSRSRSSAPAPKAR